MQQLSTSLLASAALTATGLAAEETKAAGKSAGTDRAEVMKFFKEHVLGRTLATPKTTFKWDDNKAEGDYEDQVIYNNFAETAEGFAFDVTSISKSTLYDLDPQGQRLSSGRDFSGMFVLRYEIAERASTKQLTGIGAPHRHDHQGPEPGRHRQSRDGHEGQRRQAHLERDAARLRRHCRG